MRERTTFTLFRLIPMIRLFRRYFGSCRWHGQQFFVAGQLGITFAELGQIRRMYGGKRPAECVLIFPAEQALHGELANGVEVIGSHGRSISSVSCSLVAVQVLLPGNEGLYFPFVVFYKLVVGLLSDDEIGCSGDR